MYGIDSWLVNGVDVRKLILFIFLEILVGITAYLKAQSAAVEWGNFVKASFDLFLPDLRDKLGLDGAVSADEEREVWRKLSQAYIYGNPKYMPRRNNKPPKE